MWYVQFYSYTGHGSIVCLFNTEQRAQEIFRQIVNLKKSAGKSQGHIPFVVLDDIGLHYSLNLINHVVTCACFDYEALREKLVREGGEKAKALVGETTKVGFRS